MLTNMNCRVKPIIKWAGGKSQLIHELLRFKPDDFENYYEPFLGSGSFFFALSPKKKVYLNDINPTLINLYKLVRDYPQFLIDKLEKYQLEYNSKSEEEQKKLYYEKRSLYNELKHGNKERITLFIFLNKTGFNGMYRESSNGKYNIPFGKHKKVTLYNENNIFLMSKAVKNSVITAKDCKSVIKTAKANDFIYLDPPYHPITKTANFTSYSKDNFGIQDQKDLANIAKTLSKKGCKIMISNSESHFIRGLYKDFNFHEVKANRFINCKSDARGKINELIITNY